MPFSAASSPMRFRSSDVSVPPVGFCGELMISSFVRSVIFSASSSTSRRNSFSSRSAIGTAFAPT